MIFDPKDKKHKAQLYPILKALADLEPRKTPELIMDDAVGYPVPHGADYVRNMRKGDINKAFAALTHQWLMENHFGLAHRISPEIFPMTPEMRWRDILDERAITGQLKLIPMKSVMGIVQRVSAIEAADTTIKLGQRFCLELTSDVEGHAIALQGLRDQWYPIPLGQGGVISAAVQEGENILPQTSSGHPDPLVEEHDLGLHEFVIIAASTADIPVATKRLVDWVFQGECEIHRISVQFIE